MARKIFQNYVHYTDPETGAVTRFSPGDEAPAEVVANVDPAHFAVQGDEAPEAKAEKAKIDYKKLHKDQLSDLCADRGLDFEGTKAELIKRLEDSDGALS